MKLLRVGVPGEERPALLDAAGTVRDVSVVTGDFGPEFFAGGGLARLAQAVAKPAIRDGLPVISGRTGAPIARPGKVVCIGQDGSTANMIFSVAHVIWYLSQYMVLRPGDLVNTGTPAGVALGLPDHPYLRAGDSVRLEIDGLGWAEQQFVAAP